MFFGEKAKKICLFGFLNRYGFLDGALASLAANDPAAWRSGGFQ
jgi:hypothetical protein